MGKDTTVCAKCVGVYTSEGRTFINCEVSDVETLVPDVLLTEDSDIPYAGCDVLLTFTAFGTTYADFKESADLNDMSLYFGELQLEQQHTALPV